uniref:Uncharacterized protein n=1 Tax=Anguilla anguilla TaxID=7936 RepID=A0A0E9SNB2_ANGAN
MGIFYSAVYTMTKRQYSLGLLCPKGHAV